MTTAGAALAHLMARPGWRSAPVDGGWRLIHDHDGEDLNLFVATNRDWCCIQWPLPASSQLPRSSDPLTLASTWRTLLSWNEAMYLAKFALDPAGRLVLGAEIPLVQGGWRLAERALDTVAIYARQFLRSHDGPDTVGILDNRPSRRNGTHADSLASLDTEETLARYLASLAGDGWWVPSRPTGPSWQLRYRGNARQSFSVYVTPTKDWICFATRVVTISEQSLALRDSGLLTVVLSYLLRANDALYLCKLGGDAQGQPLLMLELPAETLELSLLRLAARTLARALNEHALEIQIMASLNQDRRLADLLARHAAGPSTATARQHDEATDGLQGNEVVIEEVTE